MMSITLAAVVTMLPGVDGDRQSATVEGHLLRLEKASTLGQAGPPGKAAKHVSLTFAVQPKDPSRSFAYEVGQRFIALDAAGKEISLGKVSSFGREPAFSLAGYPPPKPDDRDVLGRNALTVMLPVLNPDATSIASLEGDLFVSDVQIQEFTFSKNELDPNVVKRLGAAEAKLYLFDERKSGVEIGFKFRLPPRSRATALAGDGGYSRDRFLLFATEGGKKTRLRVVGSSGGSVDGRNAKEDAFTRVRHDFNIVGLERRPDALHLVIPQIDYPRRHVFRLKDVPVPAPAPPQRARRPGGMG